MIKIFVIPEHYYTVFVAGFIRDLVLGLQKKDWIIVPTKIIKKDIVSDIKAFLEIDHIDIISFYLVRKDIIKAWKSESFDKNTLKVLITEDVHSAEDKFVIRKMCSSGLDYIFARYHEATKSVIPNVNIPIISFPQGATKEFVQPIRFNKKIKKALLSGAVEEDVYLLRHKAQELVNTGYQFINQRKHPGYDKKLDPLKETKNYSLDINKYLIAIADCVVLVKSPYIVAKHFEIPLSGTLMLTHEKAKKNLEELGFIEGIHYIATNESKLKETIEFWLADSQSKKALEIIKNGQKLVKSKHMNYMRTDFFDKKTIQLYK